MRADDFVSYLNISVDNIQKEGKQQGVNYVCKWKCKIATYKSL